MTVEEDKAPAPTEKTTEMPTAEKAADKPAEKTTTAVEAATQEKTIAAATTPTANTVINEQAFRQAHASPSIRKLARELGVDLGKVTGTGRKARITADDVKQFVKSVLSGQSTGTVSGSGIPPVPAQDFSKFGSIEEHKLSKINKLTGEHMTRCWLNIPHVTQYDEADITDLELFRQSLKAEAEKRGVRVTMLSFLMKALVSGMQALPKFNSSLSADGQSLIIKGYYNVGIAVDTPNGLVVPVIKAVDKKSIYQLSEDLMNMSKKARDGKLTPADMSGGSMTISSLGGIGGTAFTPIVNAPEVAILGVSRSKITPVWNGQEFEPRNMLPLSLSYDHRVIDGADGAHFTRHLAMLLSDARRLLL
ncbi:MAG: branched-chain alpha-keto acid dehydrogenase subunit E2 [Gammaproteobacteria bacterium]|nr:MAG: branched-chain alpha-keto acid dehydrogenase subunit E2 [Gammaproteobacteria bacterium]